MEPAKPDVAALTKRIEEYQRQKTGPSATPQIRDMFDKAIAELQAKIAEARRGAAPAADEDPWKVLAWYSVKRDGKAAPAARATAIRVPRVKGGLRTIASPMLHGLNLTCRLVWKAMYAMADRAPDRTIKKEYREIAQATRRRGARISDETTG